VKLQRILNVISTSTYLCEHKQTYVMRIKITIIIFSNFLLYILVINLNSYKYLNDKNLHQLINLIDLHIY